MTKVVQVAVAILKKENGEFLLANRPEGKPWAGWWEFPGGKIEAGESPERALERELQEELGITPMVYQPWIQKRFDYPETHDSPAKTVHLHFFFVTQWHGELTPKEGQSLAWQTPGQVSVEPVLPANTPIMHALTLPPIYAISNSAEMGEIGFFNALEQQLQNGLRLIQVREKQLGRDDLKQFAMQVKAMTKAYDAKVLLNDDVELAVELGLDGVHLPSKALMRERSKPDGLLVAASCHQADEIAQAEHLGLDLITLSPVSVTESHPEAQSLGWQAFAALANHTEIPVYALGGMRMDDLLTAYANGARGIAMQRAVW